jgi:hypothetical protein
VLGEEVFRDGNESQLVLPVDISGQSALDVGPESAVAALGYNTVPLERDDRIQFAFATSRGLGSPRTPLKASGIAWADALRQGPVAEFTHHLLSDFGPGSADRGHSIDLTLPMPLCDQ